MKAGERPPPWAMRVSVMNGRGVFRYGYMALDMDICFSVFVIQGLMSDTGGV